MKHNLNITLLILSLFFAAQIIGLVIAENYAVSSLPLGIEKIELDQKTSYLPIFIVILIATGLSLLLMKANAKWLWIMWFFISISITLIIALSTWMPTYIAIALSLILTSLKIFKRNMYIHNFTELFIYGGLIALIVGSFNIFSATVLLLLISIYDMIAVWKTKHMIKIAKFQNEIKIFAGLLIPYKNRVAILGGGDIAIPLLFSAVAVRGLSLYSLVIPVFSTIALFLLFYLGEKKKFYPAMPFLTLGCLVGFGVLKLLQFVF